MVANSTVPLSEFGEFGLAGLIIGVLFAGLYFTLKNAREHVNEIHNQHRAERAEWRDDLDSRQAEANRVIEKLSETIHENAEVSRENWKLYIQAITNRQGDN